MMKSLKLFSIVLTLLLGSAATANPLYSWTTKDGTPTYSPDPPPKGVSYIIVGPDLQPLQGQPVTASATSAQAPQSSSIANTAASGNLVLTPAPGSANTPVKTANNSASQPATPRAKWKPVVYADDPNPTANKPVISAPAPSEVAPVSSNQQSNQLSEACLNVRQKVILLESQFANAVTAKQMDDAIVKLSIFKKQNKGYCGL